MASILQVLPGTDGETTTQGLDNLPARVQEYYKQVLASFSNRLWSCLDTPCVISLNQTNPILIPEQHTSGAGRALALQSGGQC